MTEEDHEKMRIWVSNWKETGKVLEQLRRENIRRTVTSESIAAFDGAFRSAIYLKKPEPTSGFIEFYRILRKIK